MRTRKEIGPFSVYLNVDGRMKEAHTQLTKDEAGNRIKALDEKYALSAYPGTIRILVFEATVLKQSITVKGRKK